jgi:hypothetical protein
MPVFAAIFELLLTTTATFELAPFAARLAVTLAVLVAVLQPIEAAAKAAAVKIVSLLIVNSSSSS